MPQSPLDAVLGHVRRLAGKGGPEGTPDQYLRSPVPTTADPQDEMSWREVCEILDAELQAPRTGSALRWCSATWRA
jgi:hypothetical protein